jgi:hypothetical protein
MRLCAGIKDQRFLSAPTAAASNCPLPSSCAMFFMRYVAREQTASVRSQTHLILKGEAMDMTDAERRKLEMQLHEQLRQACDV